jgi:phosphatidylserine/phosphatidylglycerophosphate/cardiolipin synthase-like enzyme
VFNTGVAAGNVQPYFLSQAVADLDDSKSLDQQPELAAIQAQALQAADAFAAFIGAATSSLDIAIYDFRLLPGPLADQFLGAIRAAAQRGVSVRLAYDKTQETSDETSLKAFASAGGDPAPVGTHTFLARAQLPANVEVRPIVEEAIDPGTQIMHNKYMVRDAGTPAAAVLMGSANFTTDAWGIQDNNVLVITGSADLATAYERDFTDLWTTQRLTGTGKTDVGTVTVSGIDIGYSFAPGEGKATESAITAVVSAATTRIRIASMVISSPKILQALADQITAGRDVAGIYDGSEMRQVASQWHKGAPGSPSAQRLALWQAVSRHLTAKASVPFTANGPHNFMHNKVIVADDVVSTGSFNLSANATRNAENVLRLASRDLADQYAAYIDALVQRYAQPPAQAPGAR